MGTEMHSGGCGSPSQGLRVWARSGAELVPSTVGDTHPGDYSLPPTWAGGGVYPFPQFSFEAKAPDSKSQLCSRAQGGNQLPDFSVPQSSHP